MSNVSSINDILPPVEVRLLPDEARFVTDKLLDHALTSGCGECLTLYGEMVHTSGVVNFRENTQKVKLPMCIDSIYLVVSCLRDSYGDVESMRIANYLVSCIRFGRLY